MSWVEFALPPHPEGVWREGAPAASLTTQLDSPRQAAICLALHSLLVTVRVAHLQELGPALRSPPSVGDQAILDSSIRGRALVPTAPPALLSKAIPANSRVDVGHSTLSLPKTWTLSGVFQWHVARHRGAFHRERVRLYVRGAV